MNEIKITLEYIRALNPCAHRLDNYIKHYAEKEHSIREFIALDNITYEDKMWLLFRKRGFLDIKQKIRLASDFAERVLYIFEERYPDDDGPRKAIMSSRSSYPGIAAAAAAVARNSAINASNAADAYNAYNAAYAAYASNAAVGAVAVGAVAVADSDFGFSYYFVFAADVAAYAAAAAFSTVDEKNYQLNAIADAIEASSVG